MYSIKRILGGAVDYIITIAITIPLSFLGSPFDIQYLLIPSVKMFSSYGVFCAIIWFVISVLFKDLIFKNASIGKKLFGLHVVDENGRQARYGNLVLRNITLLMLLPIECLLVFFNKGVRLGDIIAKTRVTSNLQ